MRGKSLLSTEWTVENGVSLHAIREGGREKRVWGDVWSKWVGFNLGCVSCVYFIGVKYLISSVLWFHVVAMATIARHVIANDYSEESQDTMSSVDTAGGRTPSTISEDTREDTREDSPMSTNSGQEISEPGPGVRVVCV